MRKLPGLGLVVFLLISVLTVGCQASALTETKFKHLLSVNEVEKAAAEEVKLEMKFYNYKKMVAEVDPEQVKQVESFFGMIFHTQDELKAVTLNVVEFDSDTLAQQYLAKAKNESELGSMAEPIGDSSLLKEFNERGLGSIIVFKKGRIIGEILSSMPDGASPLLTAETLERLTRKVAQQL
ncbi:MAG: hypothetical protein HYX81_00880 [Chloroflexi bacterium]|nr:hypothetical protein [Chloroflexota bacterium]